MRPGTAQHSTGAEGSHAAVLQQGICGPSRHLPPGKQATGMGWLAAVKTSGAIPRHGPPAGQRGRGAEQNHAVKLFRSAAWLLSSSMSPDLAATIAAALPTLSPCCGNTLTHAMSASVGRCPLALNRQRCPPAPLWKRGGAGATRQAAVRRTRDVYDLFFADHVEVEIKVRDGVHALGWVARRLPVQAHHLEWPAAGGLAAGCQCAASARRPHVTARLARCCPVITHGCTFSGWPCL